MAHCVTCLYCKKQFNRDKEPTKKVSPSKVYSFRMLGKLSC